jgi:hypothetical protein
LDAYVQESGAFDSLVKNPLDWISRSRFAGDRLARTKSRVWSGYRLAELIGVSFPLVCCWLDDSTAPEKKNRENLWLFLERERLLIKKELTFLDFGQV